MKKHLFAIIALSLAVVSVSAQKHAVFITAGQSNADGREYVSNLPSYLKSGKYNHLRYANITSEAKTSFGDRNLLSEKRYAFQDICNYWIDQTAKQDFYAIKCTYGGTAIALGQTAAKVPVWNASKEYLDTARAYRGQTNGGQGSWPFVEGNSLAKSFSTGFSSLVDGELSKLSGGYEVKAIMWHQGESDRKAAGAYYDNLKTLIAYMRNSIYEKTGDEKAKTTPFIMGTVCHESTQYSKGVEDAQRRIAAEDPNVYLIDMSKASLRGDNLHFDSLSTEYLGKAMYNVLVKIGAVEGDTVVTGRPYKVEEPQRGDDYADSRSWDFTQPWSQASLDSLKADSKYWVARSGWGYRYASSIRKGSELQTSTGYVFPETKGLFFKTSSTNRATVNPGKYIGLYAGGITVTVPQVKPGQYIIIEAQSAKSGAKRGIVPTPECKSSLDSIQGGYASTERLTNIWWVQDTFTEPVDASFEITGGGVYIYKIRVSEAMVPTAIKNVRDEASNTSDNSWYTLSGVRVSQPTTSGIYIKNGKKVAVSEGKSLQ